MHWRRVAGGGLTMARYAKGVEWIALNDAPGDTQGLAWNAGIERLRVSLTVTLLADLTASQPRTWPPQCCASEASRNPAAPSARSTET